MYTLTVMEALVCVLSRTNTHKHGYKHPFILAAPHALPTQSNLGPSYVLSIRGGRRTAAYTPSLSRPSIIKEYSLEGIEAI